MRKPGALMKRFMLAVMLIPSIASAQNSAPPPAAPVPEGIPLPVQLQACLFLKKQTYDREMDAMSNALDWKMQLDALKAKPSDKEMTQKFNEMVAKFTAQIATKDGEVAVANRERDEARANMGVCPTPK